MPKCKNCNSEISRLDKEICPFCGAKKPLVGVDATTEDFTKAFDAIHVENKVVTKSRKVTAILAMTLGVFGGHMFYIGRKKYGFLILGISLGFIALLGCVLFFSGALRNALAFLIPYFVLEAIMIVSGILILKGHDGLDGNGEFLK